MKRSTVTVPSWAEPSQNCAESRGKKLCYVVSFSHAEWHLILRLPLLTADRLLSFLKPDICWIFQTETVIKFNTWGLINLWLPSGYYFLRHAATLNLKSVSFSHTVSISSSGPHCSVHFSSAARRVEGLLTHELLINRHRERDHPRRVKVS